MATADFVIRLTNGSPVNLASNAPRRRGDIVYCRIQPHKSFGKRIVPPTYGILTVTGISKAQVQAMCQYNHTEWRPGDELLPKEMRRLLFHIRIGNWINLKTFPAGARAQLEKGSVTIDYATFSQHNQDRVAVAKLG